MSGTKSRAESTTASANAAVHRQMRAKALRVPWRDVAGVVDQILEWHSFSLWVRAIADSEEGLPVWLRDAIKQRCPGFLQSGNKAAGFESLWLDILSWADDTFFAGARQAGWLDAAHYYAGRDPRSEQIWGHWTESAAQWKLERLWSYPGFEHWRQAALQRPVPDSSSGSNPVPPDELHRWILQYVEWEAFAYWVRTVVEVVRSLPNDVAGELNRRCPGFLNAEGDSLTSTDSTGFFRVLIAWVESHAFSEIKHTTWIESIRAYARQHVRAERIVEYWAVCGSRWQRNPPATFPSFEAWLLEIEDFVTR